MLLQENELTHAVNYVAFIIYKVALMIDFAASRVSQFFALKTCSIQYNVTFGILFKSTDDIFDIKALTVIVIQFLDITVIQLLLIKLFPAISVDDVPRIALNKPSKAIDSPLFLVDIKTLFGLVKLEDSTACTLVELVIKVAH